MKILSVDLLASKMEAGGAAVTADEVAAFTARVARIMIMPFARPLVIRMLGLLLLLGIRFIVRGLYQRPDELKHTRNTRVMRAKCVQTQVALAPS